MRLDEHARARGEPSLATVVSATGGAAVTLGVLLITIDMRAGASGHLAEAGLFAALIVAGYLVLALLGRETHPAAVTAIVLGVPGALGWWLLPGAHSFGDIRPFLVLTILAWVIAFVAPRTRGRTIFVGAAALVLWLWILGEVAGTGAYSAHPVPSPPPHTFFSLQRLAQPRAAVQLGDLDPNDPLFHLAQECDFGDAGSCDDLYREAPAGSDFSAFGASCGNAQPDESEAGRCSSSGLPGTLSPSPFPRVTPITPLAGATDDKSLEIGLVSVLFGVGYLGALYVLDRKRWNGVATAFVIPGVVALTTGTQSLGNAAHHAWAGGAMTFVAGLFIGVIGDRTGRRFTTWTGGIVAALGGLTVALDSAHITQAARNGDVKLAGPGLIVVSFGIGLIATAFIIGQIMRRPSAPPPDDLEAERGPGPEAAPPAPAFDTAPPWPPEPT
jgi:hypothetical protein